MSIKKSFLLVLSIILFCNVANGQKIYVWAPDVDKPTQHPVFEQTDTVDIVIFDGRNIPEKSKVEFSPAAFIEYLANDIQYAYEGATFVVLPATKYFKPAADGHITLKIGIAAYQAGFGTDVDIAIGNVGGNFSYGVSPKGMWNAITSFYVRTFDKRNGSDIVKESEVVAQKEKANLWGYATAKKCLNETYVEARSKMFFFIDGVFMQ